MSVVARYGMVVVLAGLLLGGCSGGIEPLGGGSGSETPNSVTLAVGGGAVWGSGPGGVAIWINPVSHVPSRGELAVPDVVTDDRGRYSIRGLEEGYYSVVGTDSTRTRGFFAESLWVSSVGEDSMSLRLDSLGVIEGAVQSALRPKLRRVALLGTPFTTLTNDVGLFVLERVPRGRYVLATDTLVGVRAEKVINPDDDPKKYEPSPLELVGASKAVEVESARTVVVELIDAVVDTL